MYNNDEDFQEAYIMKNKKLQIMGISVAVLFLVAAYVCFLHVNVAGFFICYFLACGFGLAFSDKDK